ncbi:hypothetical protein B0H14DRAFT_2968537 [Mycena olivaceomarginata]|nr:hypothetical protein B0H14DRAFT_2968537 [Mycena olivaceomarginata]
MCRKSGTRSRIGRSRSRLFRLPPSQTSFDPPRASIPPPLAGPSSSARTFPLAHTDNALPPSSCAPHRAHPTARTFPIAPAPKAKAKAPRRLTRRPRSSFLLPLARSATSATNIPHQRRIVSMGPNPSTLGLILLSLNRCIHRLPSLPLP